MLNANIKISRDGNCWIDNVQFPAVGFGTYTLKDDVCRKSIKIAFETGYRIFDTATYYDNFQPIGEAIKEFPRESLHLISKVPHDKHHAGAIREDLKQTLSKLDTDYLDSYLLHWPNSGIPIEETLFTMQELKTEGKIRYFGMCNVTVNHLIRAMELSMPITWVQNEMSPFFYDPEILGFCHEHGIGFQGWRPLGGRGNSHQNPELLRLSKKYQKTPAAVALQWIIQHGVMPLPSSQNPIHIKENFDLVGSFEIEMEDMQAMDEVAAKGERKRLLPGNSMGFTDEFDFTLAECWPNL